MPRSYVKKREKKKWNDEQMMEAMEKVQTGEMTCYGAAKRYGIPTQTLRDRVKGKVAKGCKVGWPTALTQHEEKEIAETCMLFAEWRFGINKEEVIGVVGDYCRVAKKKVPFKDGTPGDDWWKGFMARYPDLAKRKPQQHQLVRAKATTEQLVDHWFNDVLGPTLDELDLHDKPQQLFNADESFLPLSGKPDHIICKKGIKSPQMLIGGSGRENITIHCCVSASGQYIPPYVIYTGQKLMFDHTQGGPLGTRYGVSPSGWMTNKTFLDWFSSQFIPSLPRERPVLLILDGHKSHVSYAISSAASCAPPKISIAPDTSPTTSRCGCLQAIEKRLGKSSSRLHKTRTVYDHKKIVP